MLEIEEVDRIGFTDLLENVEMLMVRCSRNILGSNNSQRNI